MKKYTMYILCLFLVLFAAGCTNSSPLQEEIIPEDTQPGSITVSNIDEFIAAIGNDAFILIEPGTYTITKASTYGKDTGNPSCYWSPASDGWELHILDVDRLTILGSGADCTTIETEPSYANVLYFEDCTNLILADFTAGHTIATNSCSADVIFLNGCSRTDISRLGLFGCGANGISTLFCNNTRINDCDIYHCTASGIWCNQSQKLTISNCRVWNLGENGINTAICAFGFYDSENITIQGCNIRDNNLWNLILLRNSYDVVLKDSGAADNYILDAVFDLYCSSFILDNTEMMFPDNSVKWYTSDSELAYDADGNSLSPFELQKMYLYIEDPEITPVDIEMREVTVTTVDEFLNAIGPNTCIYLDNIDFNLSSASDYGGYGGMYYEWRDEYDGPGLWIMDVDNLMITTPDHQSTEHTLCSVPRYASVLAFEQCSNVTISGLTAGHTQEPGFCVGGVFRFDSCRNVSVTDTNMYGCGTWGIESELSSNLTVQNCSIYSCSYGGMNLYRTYDVTVSKCSFWDLDGPVYALNGCKNVVIDGKLRENGDYSF